MDIEQARNILNGIEQSIDRYCRDDQEISIIGELCNVIRFLLDEIDRTKTPTITILHCETEHRSVKPNPVVPSLPVEPRRSNPLRRRRLNAGDTE